MSRELKVVECTSCGWHGTEDKLMKEYNEIEMTKLEHCPNCDGAWNLVENGFTVKKSS